MENLYSRLLSFTGDGVYRYSLDDGRILMANEGLVRVLDLTCKPEELVGKRLDEVLIYTEQVGTIRDQLQRLGEIHGFEYHFRTLKGDDRWVIHDSFIANDPLTNQRIVEVIVKDMTDRKRVEEALRNAHAELESRVQGRTSELAKTNDVLRAEIAERRRAEEALRLSEEHVRRRAEEVEKLMDLVPAAIWIAHDPRCHQVTGNKTANQLYEARAGENVSVGPDPGQPNAARRFFQDGRELPVEELPMRHASARNTDVRNSEFEVLLPSGQRRTLLGSASPLREADGQVRGCVAAFLDITDRKRAEDALRRAHDELEEKVRERTVELQATVSELRRSEEKYRTLVESVHEIIYNIDLDGNLTYISPQVERYGLSPEQMMGRNILEFIAPEDREKVAADFQKTKLAGAEFVTTFRVAPPDGRVSWFEEQGRAQRDGYGTMTGMAGVLVDITERKKAEESLRRTLERLRELEVIVNRSPAMVFLWRVAEGWPVEFVSENVSQLGYTAEDFISRRVSWPGIVHSDDGPWLEAGIARHLKSGKTEFTQEYRLCAKSGEIRWVEDRSVVLRDSHGDITHIQGIVLDVTERKRAETALRESEARHRALVEGMPAIVYTARGDEASTTFYVSPQVKDILGFSPQEYMSDQDIWRQRLHPEDRRRVMTETARCRAMGLPFVSEYRVVRKDGAVVWFRDAAVIAQSPSDGSQVMHGVMLDITERKRAEAALMESEEKFRILAEESPNMISIVWKGRVIYANRRYAEVMGYLRDDLYSAGLESVKLHAPEYAVTLKTRFQRHVAGQDLPPCELTLPSREGSPLHVLLATKLISYNDDKAMLSIMTDISRQKQVQGELHARQEQLGTLTQQLSRAQDEERRRIAAGLHDDVGQLLTAGLLNLGELRKKPPRPGTARLLGEMESLLMQASERIRELTFELCPHTLYEVGFADAVEELGEHMKKRFGLVVAVKRGTRADPVPEALKPILYQAVRELLFNVFKHAKAKRAVVRLGGSANTIRIVVEDDGQGFAAPGPDQAWTHKGGYGLFHLCEKFRAIGGHVSVASNPGAGTRVTLEAPKAPASRRGRQREPSSSDEHED